MYKILYSLIGWLVISSLITISGCSKKVGLNPGEEAVLEKANFSFSADRLLFDEYRISPGDQLDVLFTIKTWDKEHAFRFHLGDTITIKFLHASELNETQKIRPDGFISLPYIGEVQVEGKTIQELTSSLQGKYKKILRNPDLYITAPVFLEQIRELKRDLHTASRGLSRLVTVRPDGYTTFPMVGDLLVADRSMKDVANSLNAKYQKISDSLYVDLFLEKHSGSLVYVLGEVNSPGAYTITKPTSVLEAVALAGSYGSDALLDNVVVVRKHGKKIVGKVIDLNKGLHLNEGASFMFLQPDDIVFIPKTRISETAQLMRHIGDIIFFRGWSISGDFVLDDNPVFGSDRNNR